MSKIILAFLLLFFSVYVGIDSFRQLTGKQKWELTKSVFYSIMCASAAVGLVAVIVFLF